MSNSQLRTALIGNPVGHSVSDVLFSELYSAVGAKLSYRHYKIAVEGNELDNIVRRLIAESYLGFNVTLPYKRLIIRYLTSLDESASQISAVNTVKIQNQKTIGFNTDWEGIYYPIHKKCNEGNYSICIWGTGGASRAAIKASRKLTSGRVYVLYRSLSDISENTQDLLNNADKHGVTLCPYDDIISVVNDSQVIINATPVGMVGVNTAFPFSFAELSGIDMQGKIFMDAVFNPVETTSISFFKQHGSYTIDGLWMMIYQGISALSIWLDRPLFLSNNSCRRIHHRLEEVLNERPAHHQPG